MSTTSDFSWASPDPADEIGLVALDYTLSPERLISAYRHGIFPWPDGTPFSPIPWVCPPRRAILEFAELHVPKNLRRSQRALARLRFSVDEAFELVIHACAAVPRRGQSGTWITPAMSGAYTELHRQGLAHSVEAWDGEALVGGLYGVSAGGVFTGESMFHRLNDASKLCVLYLIDQLQRQGATWMDIQQLTPHFALLGAKEISRDDFLDRLQAEQAARRPLFKE
ncbi:MAG TPA: leucyl/phenylalanyl-tRNA--protein transferase [Opitutaceae bacterium]|nr:leucyl/phenylalanyl-tRNA--protein transferase [Opitutaceae bacterium]